MLEEWLDTPHTSAIDTNASRAAVAASLAVRGGDIAMERFESTAVSWKADGSMLTDADVAVQGLLEKEIAARFPADGILGEEGLLKPAENEGDGCWWILDPIDGTNNFGRGLPGFAVSVGIFSGGRPVVGAVYDPVARWLFLGVVGEGAWLNGRPLELHPEPLSARSLFAIRSPYEDDTPAYVRRWLTRYRLRRFGSTALQLCYVALGALTFVHDHKVALWDIAGALPVLLEAGGVVTTPDGAPLVPFDTRAYDGRSFALVAGSRPAIGQILDDIRA